MDLTHILITGITFFIVLSILVLVHELGHFFAARAIGVGVEEFGIGLPPRIFGKKIAGVIYSVNWLPIGGFVRLTGEDEAQEAQESAREKDPKRLSRYFWARSKTERAIILLAGVFMNFVLAVALTMYLVTQGVPTPTDRTHIESVLPGSPAEVAGLVKDDIVLSLQYQKDGVSETRQIKTPEDLIKTTKDHLGEEIVLTVLRGKEKILLSIVPRKEYPKGEGPMGISIDNHEIRKVPLTQAPVEAIKINLVRSGLMFTSILGPIKKLITFQSVCGEVAGPIGIARVTGQAVQIGFNAVIELTSLISLNLALLNVLPIPALDGGRLAFVILEKFRKRKIRPAFENSAHQIGFILLIAFILLISINDIFCPSPLQ